MNTRPWLCNSFDYYIYNLHTDTGTYGFYKDIDSHTADYPPFGTSKDYDFYFLDLNENPNGVGSFFFYEELDRLCYDILINKVVSDDLDDPEEDEESEDYSFVYKATNSQLTNSQIVWSRKRQKEWYSLYRKEYNLDEAYYVDEQDLLDWLGAKFTITRITL